MDYQHILVAIDLSNESNHVMQRAAAVAKISNAQLSVLHVIEPLSFAYGGDLPLDFSGLQDDIHQQARKQLQDFAETYNIDDAHQYLIVGRTEHEIRTCAEKLDCDLIILGTHARSGLALLLGSTSSSVLHGVSCDVLSVNVKNLQNDA